MPVFPRLPFLWLLTFALVTCESAASTFLTQGYALRIWQTEDGLPQNLVTSAVQTHDSYLWFGTPSGLVRFDGERFQLFDSTNTPALRDQRITRLFEDAQRTLWIGHESGAVSRCDAGHFSAVAALPAASSQWVIGLGTDEQDRLQAMVQSGGVVAPGAGHRIPSLIGSTPPAVMAWTRSEHGRIWVAENGQVARLADDRLTPLELPAPRLANYAIGIAAAADGGVWILCDLRIREWRDGRWTRDLGGYPWPDGPLSSCLELRDGTLAIGTIFSGLYLIFPDGRPPVHFDREHGLPQNWIRFLYEDREGTLWAGIGSAGLASIHPSAFSVLNSPQWQGCSVLSLAPGRGSSLWIGTDGAGLYHHADGVWRRYGDPEGLTHRFIIAVAESPAGELWVAPGWWGGPVRFDGRQFVRPPWVTEKSSPVAALAISPVTGDLLVGSHDGVLQAADDRATWLARSPGDSAGGACAVVQDEKGIIWGGFREGGLVRIAGEQSTFFHRKDGLPSEAVQCLLADNDGTLWIGTADHGLARLKDGRFASLGVGQGLADQAICHIEDDGAGFFWISTHHGLQRIARTELNRCADGAISSISGRTYDDHDGLPTIEFSGGLQGAGCRTPDGRLHFASSRGVVSVDPARITSNPIAPPVVIESLTVDGHATPVAGATLAHRLAPDHRRLEFQFSGLSFVAPNKVLFKYRLDGIDADWVDAGPRRTAFYSRLPAGSYRFRVISCNNDGVWNTTGASLAFTVAPFFWQTWWFIDASLLLAATAIALLARQLTRRRLQRKIEQMERRHTLERERTRIAQDIHDDVGASLSRIAMLSQPAQRELAQPERASAVLSRIYSTAHEVTQALDEIVWAVDPRHDMLDSLVDYMGRFAQDFLAAASVRCRLDLPVQVPAWPLSAETRHSLFLAFKEALNNAVRHAAATEVHISFALRPDAFVLSVRDNGRGFAPERGADTSRSDPGNGLDNMRSRLARIGGRCEITSAPGAGTTVNFIASVPPAGRGKTSRPGEDARDRAPSS